MNLAPGVEADALFSTEDPPVYRYSLTRDWDREKPVTLWVMLNPSTATHLEDDPTIRRCQGFSRAWGQGGIIVANIFALRSTDPKALYDHPDPIGPGNDEVIELLARNPRVESVVAAWGAHGDLDGRGQAVARLLARVAGVVHALSTTKSGQPGHPLYLGAETRPIVYAQGDLL